MLEQSRKRKSDWERSGGDMGKVVIVIIILLLVGLCAGVGLFPTAPSDEEIVKRTQMALTVVRQATADEQERARWAQEAAGQTAVALNVEKARSEGTLQAAKATAEWWGGQQTATAVEGTRQAQAATAKVEDILRKERQVATERAWQTTATADALKLQMAVRGTETAQQATQRYVDQQATVDAGVAMSLATQQAANAESATLATERERQMNGVRAALPWVFLVLVVFVGLVLIWRWFGVRPIYRDARGDAPLVMMDGWQGRVLVDADRNVTGALETRGGKAAAPMLSPMEMQDAVNRRDQAVDFHSRGLPGDTRMRGRTLTSVMLGGGVVTGGEKIKIYRADERPKLDEGVMEVLDAQWKEVNDGKGNG
jgi:hypothetical protein